VAITAGRITDVGKDLGLARRTLKTDGLLVTPGWIDGYTTCGDSHRHAVLS